MIYIQLIFLFIISLHAQQEVADPQVQIENTSSDEAAVIEELLVPFKYKSEGKRDPFLYFRENAKLSEKPMYGPFLELQETLLDEAELKGVFMYPTTSKALFNIKMGDQYKIVKLSVGDYIGEDFGYIVSIKKDKVIIVQTKEQNGELFSSTKVLTIKK